MSAKKKLLITLSTVLAVVAIVAVSVLGTVAYMTSASKVSNVFTVGKVKVLLDESLVDENGVPDVSGARTDRNSYHLMPGGEYVKDPTITVDATTEPCYIFLVTRNQITSIEVQGDPDRPTMAQQMVANGWGIYKDTTAGSRVWVYCGLVDGQPTKVNPANMEWNTSSNVTIISGTDREAAGAVAKDTIKVFQKFYITTDKSTNLDVYSGAEVTINAVAIQSTGYKMEEGTVPGSKAAIDAAWAAVVSQFPYIQDGDIENN